jgi:DNA-binding NarL/FixJ family response regulator
MVTGTRTTVELPQLAAPILVVDDSALVGRSLQRLLSRYGDCLIATSAKQAAELLEREQSFAALIIDVRLRDGSGLDVLTAARHFHEAAPALVYTGAADREIINRSAALNARFVCKPFGPAELAPFLEDVLRRYTDDPLYPIMESARHRWSLSPREAEILRAALRRQSPAEYLAHSGMTKNTYKTHVRHLLEKSDYETLLSLTLDLSIRSAP